MPTYEYRCEDGHVFDVMQRMADDPVTTCEVCGASVQRVFHPIAVHFKGKGFYNTDYGTKKRQRELKEAGEGGGSSDGASSSDSKTETKSDSGSSSSDSKSSDSGSDSSSKKTSEGLSKKKAEKAA